MQMVAGGRYGDIDSQEANLINTSQQQPAINWGFWLGTTPQQTEKPKTGADVGFNMNTMIMIGIVAIVLIVVLMKR